MPNTQGNQRQPEKPEEPMKPTADAEKAGTSRPGGSKESDRGNDRGDSTPKTGR
jgi:hypothetical protein